MKMTDEVLKELWDTKDNIAKEYLYNVDALAECYLKKQATRQVRLHTEAGDKTAEQGAKLGRSQARAG